jgi:protein subunit release factor A
MRLLFSLTRKDFEIEDLTSGGKGGQHANRSHTRIRITHPASGAVGESSDERSQFQNKKQAFERLANSQKFKQWHKVETARRMGQAVAETEEQIYARIDAMIAQGLKDGSIQVEYYHGDGV